MEHPSTDRELAAGLRQVASDFAATAGVCEVDALTDNMYGDMARLACRDLPRLAELLDPQGKLAPATNLEASSVLRDVGASVEANRPVFSWLAPALSPEVRDLMGDGGGVLLGAAMNRVAAENSIVRDDLLSERPGHIRSVADGFARMAIASGRGMAA